MYDEHSEEWKLPKLRPRSGWQSQEREAVHLPALGGMPAPPGSAPPGERTRRRSPSHLEAQSPAPRHPDGGREDDLELDAPSLEKLRKKLRKRLRRIDQRLQQLSDPGASAAGGVDAERRGPQEARAEARLTAAGTGVSEWGDGDQAQQREEATAPRTRQVRGHDRPSISRAS